MNFGSDGIYSESDLTDNGWSTYLTNVNSNNFYTSTSVINFLYSGSAYDGYIQQTLPSGYDYFIAAWGATYGSTSQLYVCTGSSCSLKETVSGSGSTYSSTTTTSTYSEGDSILIYERDAGVAVVDNIQVCRN